MFPYFCIKAFFSSIVRALLRLIIPVAVVLSFRSKLYTSSDYSPAL
nr:MAG TPA: hypothetical protein [Caudoviricetes sp.]